MKVILFTAALLVISACSTRESQDLIQERIELDIKEKYPGSTDFKFEKKEDGMTVEFIQEGKPLTAYFENNLYKDNNWEFTTKKITFLDLPEIISAKVTSEYPDASVKDILEKMDKKGRIVYVLTMDENDSSFTTTLDYKNQ